MACRKAMNSFGLLKLALYLTKMPLSLLKLILIKFERMEQICDSNRYKALPQTFCKILLKYYFLVSMAENVCVY